MVAHCSPSKEKVKLDAEQCSLDTSSLSSISSVHRFRFFDQDRAVYSRRGLTIDRIVSRVYIRCELIVDARIT